MWCGQVCTANRRALLRHRGTSDLETLCLCGNWKVFGKWSRKEKNCSDHKANTSRWIVSIFCSPPERIFVPFVYGKVAERPNGQPNWTPSTQWSSLCPWLFGRIQLQTSSSLSTLMWLKSPSTSPSCSGICRWQDKHKRWSTDHKVAPVCDLQWWSPRLPLSAQGAGTGEGLPGRAAAH